MDIHIVDDDKLQLELVKAIAESSDLTAQVYSSAESYLKYFSCEDYIPPRLAILTDVRMLGKSGYELMSEIRKQKPGQRFVLITGTPNDNNIENEKACFYLTKPVRLNRLRSVFESIGKCAECGNRPTILRCESLSDLKDFNIVNWHCPHKDNKLS